MWDILGRIGGLAIFCAIIWIVMFFGFRARSRYGYTPDANMNAAGCATATLAVMLGLILLKNCFG